MSFDITIPGGESRRLLTAGKYCPEDIVVTAEGGVTPPGAVQEKGVNFYDYDGTLLYSYTVEEAQALTELPPLPTQPGLICQGWNYDLATIKDYNRAVNVGATYITDDGKTRIYITLQEGRTSPMLGVCPNGTVTVDWGDGSTPDTLTGTSTSTVKWTPNHAYAQPGDYVITLTVEGSMGFYGSSSDNQHSAILRHSASAATQNQVYQNSVQRIELGAGVTSIGSYAFYNCHSLSSIVIPEGVTSIGSYAFGYCYSFASIVIPEGVTSIGSYAFYGCYSLAILAIPNSVTSIAGYAFGYCYSLAIPVIPNSVTSIGNSTFRACYSLANIVIPDGVTSIGVDAFYGCYSLAMLRFNPATPPRAANSGAFTNIPTDCIISVPVGSLSAYTSATNYPSASTYTYIEED